MLYDHDCTLCPLSKQAKTVCMPGVGPKDARVVIVGEAPGETEDKLGEPFLGAAGKLLDTILQEVGIKREDVFITNAVKCRPVAPDGGNGTPTASQVGKCRIYLDAELEQLRPRVIICLGNVAARGVLGQSGITKLRGTKLSRTIAGSAIPVIATFHPSAYLHGHATEILDNIKSDFQRAVTYLTDTEPLRPVTWSWGATLDLNAPLWVFDLETNGKEINDPAFKIIMVGISDGKCVSIYGPDTLSTGILLLYQYRYAPGQHRLFGHNSTGFDAEALYKVVGRYLETEDTLVLAHQIDERVGTAEAHGKGKLESLAMAWLNVPPWKQQVTWNWDDELTPDMLAKTAQYNAEDVKYTFDLAKLLIEKAEQLDVAKGYEISNTAAINFAHSIDPHGIAINMDKLYQLKGELTADAIAAEVQVKTALGYDLNLNSPKQVAAALYGTLGLRPHHYTKTGSPSTDELSIKSILVDIAGVGGQAESVLRGILRVRENTKLAQFLESYEELQVNGRLYPETSVTSTVTYRTSSYHPNIQQIPHDPRVRGLITADPGNVLTEADYSQIELREIAEWSGSAVMRDLFIKGIDPHKYMAALITNKPMELVTKDERYVAKPVNFGLGYGGDTYTLRKQALTDYDIVMTEAEAQRLHDLFHETYQLEPWYEAIAMELRKTGQIRNPLGRIRHLPNIFSDNPKLRLEALRQAINFPIQSFSCDIALLAINLAVRKFALKVVAFIHDALYIESTESQAKFVPDTLRRIMTELVPETLSKQYGIHLVVPLDVDIKQTFRDKKELTA